MDYTGNFVNRFCCSGGRRGAVGRVCCEEGPADGVEGQGEDGEDEGDESPAGAEGGDDHGGRRVGLVMKDSLDAPSMLSS